MSETLLAALDYAERGWYVFPLKAQSKEPATSHGLKDATTDPEQIRKWFEGKDRNIGVALEPSGLLVLDVDSDEGDQALAARASSGIPRTVAATTGRGAHLYFRGTGKSHNVLPGVDVKSAGGYVVVPPSIHPDGSPYKWVISPAEALVADLNPPLQELVEAAAPPLATVVDLPILEGERNQRAFRDASAMRRRGQGADAILAALLADDRYQPPLPEAELRDIARRVAATYEPDADLSANEKWAERQATKKRSKAAQEFVPLPLVATVAMADVEREKVDWLWSPYLPLGKLVILDGDPGLGKSTLALDLAARITRGGRMPDAEPALFKDGAGVVIYSLEDGLGDTVKPRLDAAGADLSRVRAFNTSGLDRLPTIPDDLDVIEREINYVGARLLILDPLMGMFSKGVDAHVDQAVRQAMHPLAAVAERTGCTVLMIRHLNKVKGNAAVYRGGGSIGIIGVVRSGLVVAKSPDDPKGTRVLGHVKSNLAREGYSLNYAIEDCHGIGKVAWKGVADVSADELVNQDVAEAPARAEAAEFLRDYLKDGRQPANEVKKAAEQAAISFITLKRAKASLGVEALKDGMGGRWYWSLPAAEGDR